jgi:hypothetical protein
MRMHPLAHQWPFARAMRAMPRGPRPRLRGTVHRSTAAQEDKTRTQSAQTEGKSPMKEVLWVLKLVAVTLSAAIAAWFMWCLTCWLYFWITYAFNHAMP